MHSMIFVIGDDPIGQLTQHYYDTAWERGEATAAACNCQGGPDWLGIGGRFTGALIPKPGATGKVYGDAMPGFEAAIVGMSPGAVRPGVETRPGVDQIRAGDVDWNDTPTPRAVLAGGTWHDSKTVLTVRESVSLMIDSLPGIPVVPERQAAHQRALSRGNRKMIGWYLDVYRPAVDAASERGELVTVVDIHE